MRKPTTRLLALLMLILLAAGCSKTPAIPVEEPTQPIETEPAAPTEKIFRWIATGEDSTINPHNASAVPNYEIVDLIQVSLYKWTPSPRGDKAVAVPCLAQGEPVTEDGYTWTITVSPEAKWSNGEAITAHTFLYSWKMGLDPNLAYVNADRIAAQYITVENALEYYSQMAQDAPPVDWEDVGFHAVDDHTLEIRTTQRYTADQVMRHFAFRSTSPVYEPLYEAGMNPERTATSYGTDLETFLSCGPFTLTLWVKASQRVFEKNPNFIHADEIHLDRITCRVVADEAARLELFESGESDYVILGAAGLAKYAEDPGTMSYDQKTIRTIEVNQNNPDKPVLADAAFRRALYYAIDRQALARLTDSTAAPFFLSTTGVSFSDGTTYRSMEAANDWLPENDGYDPVLALELFEQAMKDHSLDSIALTLTYSENVEALRTASEYLQSQFAQLFGEDRFTLSLRAMPHTAALDLMRESVGDGANSWDLCWSGLALAAESYEPHKKFAPYLSTAANRYTEYRNAFLDENYPLLLTEEYRLDEQATFDLTVEIEKSIILEDVTCIPVVQEKNFVLFSPQVKLPVDQYVGSFGFGWEYADIAGGG